MRTIRGNQIAMVFQEPMTSLNPVHTHRRPDRRGGAHPPGPVQAAQRMARAVEMLQAGAHSRPGAARRRLPAPVLRRHAPARDDRDGLVVQPQAADRRRTDHRAGRDDPGADPQADGRAQRPRRRLHHADHARPGRDRRDRAPGGRDVCRAQGRGGHGRRLVRAPGASLHPRPDGVDSARAPGRAHPAPERDSRHRAVAARVGAGPAGVPGLRICAALRLCPGRAATTQAPPLLQYSAGATAQRDRRARRRWAPTWRHAGKSTRCWQHDPDPSHTPLNARGSRGRCTCSGVQPRAARRGAEEALPGAPGRAAARGRPGQGGRRHLVLASRPAKPCAWSANPAAASRPWARPCCGCRNPPPAGSGSATPRSRR